VVELEGEIVIVVLVGLLLDAMPGAADAAALILAVLLVIE